MLGHTFISDTEAGLHRRALHLVIMMGVVSLCADVTYEGARSITGPFLALLGASGAAVGLVAGFGEFIGYGLRLGSGYLVDRTRRYWTIALFGYTLNLLAVPALALAGRWEVAAFLMVLERTGKAIRKPARDVILSHAASRIGRGWGFGLHEALDQIGAVLGPLLAAGVLALGGSYRQAFALLGIAAVLALVILVVVRMNYPHPSRLERPLPESRSGLGRVFWIYLGAVALVAAGYADFPLIAFRLQTTAVACTARIPVLYALAMGADAVAALVCGRLFDRFGLIVLAVAVLLPSVFAPLVFLGGITAVTVGMVCWGIGMGAQESIMRAIIADLVPPHRRGTAYGIFNAGYGLTWLAGSTLMGVLLDRAIGWLVIFSVVSQVAAVLILLLLSRVARLRGRGF